jgi:isonocardicin synthase
MILGLLDRMQMTEDKVLIFFEPFTYKEKLYAFNYLKDNRMGEVYYPLVLVTDSEKKEKISPADGWKYDENRKSSLARGESELRSYTTDFLNRVVRDKNQKFVVFDPACSTGDFLYSIKNKFPNAYTIGQDLSRTMVEEASKKIDKALVGNSMNTEITDGSVDFLFFRFINSEVVNTEDAHNLFNSLIKKVRVGGYIIVFGHSPVLVSSIYMKSLGLDIKGMNGYDKESDSVFQYYIMKKTKKTKDMGFTEFLNTSYNKINIKM